MNQRDLLLKLAKLVVAASWEDGDLDASEIIDFISGKLSIAKEGRAGL